MKIKNLKTAVQEAKRFIERSEALEAAHAHHIETYPRAANEGYIATYLPKERGAVTRSSLDLTRALATLRQER